MATFTTINLEKEKRRSCKLVTRTFSRTTLQGEVADGILKGLENKLYEICYADDDQAILVKRNITAVVSALLEKALL